MSALDDMNREYDRDRNWRVAQAFDIDTDLIDALCADDEDGDSCISDYDIREMIIAAGRMIREKISFEDIFDVIDAAYIEVVGSTHGKEAQGGN